MPIVVIVLSAFLAAGLAKMRGYNPLPWGGLAAVASTIGKLITPALWAPAAGGLIVIAIIATRPKKNAIAAGEDRHGEFFDQGAHRFPCPSCGEMVPVNAKQCQYCTTSLTDKDRVVAAKEVYRRQLRGKQDGRH